MTVRKIGKTLSRNLNREETGKGGRRVGVRELTRVYNLCCDVVYIYISRYCYLHRASAVSISLTFFMTIFYHACFYCC